MSAPLDTQSIGPIASTATGCWLPTRPRIWRVCQPWLLALTLTAAVSTADALSSDREQPISVEADFAELDQATGIGTYRGNVVVVQGTLRVNADRIDIKTVDGALEHIVATGEPVDFKLRPDNATKDVLGGGLQADYFAGTEQLVLTGEAWVRQGDDIVRGNRIEYDIPADRVSAKAGGDAGERVRMIIQPRDRQQPGSDE